MSWFRFGGLVRGMRLTTSVALAFLMVIALLPSAQSAQALSGGGDILPGQAGRALAAAQTGAVQSDAVQIDAVQVLENMLSAQRGLLDFTANVTLRVDLPVAKLVPLSFKLYSKRPNKVKAVWSGASLLPRRGLFFPDPAQFTAGGYFLAMVGVDEYQGRSRYILDVTPEAARGEPLRWRFWIDETTWLIAKARMTDPSGEQSTLEADYVQAGEACWVPGKMRGKGAMLLLDFFPYLGLEWLAQKTGLHESLEFSATFQDYRVNVGLEDAFFSP